MDRAGREWKRENIMKKGEGGEDSQLVAVLMKVLNGGIRRRRGRKREREIERERESERAQAAVSSHPRTVGENHL